MHADGGGLKGREVTGLEIDRPSALDRNTELVFTQTGGDVGMRFYCHVGIDAERESCTLAEVVSTLRQQLKFRFALNVEEKNARMESRVDLPRLLTHAREDNPCQRLRGGAANTFQFPTGDDIESAPLALQPLEKGKRGVRLHRIADGVLDRCERVIHPAHAFTEIVGGVHVKRSSKMLCELRQIDAGDVQLFLLVTKRTRCGKRVHIAMLPGPAPERVPICAGRAYCSLGMTTQAITYARSGVPAPKTTARISTSRTREASHP